MDRKEIKKRAKEIIKGNKWKILWPLLVISLISNVLNNFIGPKYDIDVNSITKLEDLANLTLPTPTPTQAILSGLVSLLVLSLGVAYIKYLLKIVRGEEPEFNDIINCFKERWATILLVELVGGVIIVLFSLLFVIPGIIRAIAYAMTSYIVVETDLSFENVLKKSRSMMNGYKWDYFVFMLSFIGWMLLAPFTLFILLIWLIPYMIVAKALYYEKLKEING